MMRCGKKQPKNNIGRFNSHHKTFTDKPDVFGSYHSNIILMTPQLHTLVKCKEEDVGEGQEG